MSQKASVSPSCYCSWLGTGYILLLLAGRRTHSIAPGWAQDTFYCSWLGTVSQYSLPGTRPLPLAFWSNLHPTWWPNISFLNARLVIPSLPWLASMRLRAFCHFIIIYLFLLAVPGLHCCPAYSPAAECAGFPSGWLLLLLWKTGSKGVKASVVVAHGLSSCGSQVLEHRFSSCGSWA